MASTFLFDETSYSLADIAQVIKEQIAQPYPFSDNLRTAAMYCPKGMSGKEFGMAAIMVGVHAGSARNRLNEVRKMQKEFGEI